MMNKPSDPYVLVGLILILGLVLYFIITYYAPYPPSESYRVPVKSILRGDVHVDQTVDRTEIDGDYIFVYWHDGSYSRYGINDTLRIERN